jgi:hypothetical protein
MQSVEHPEHVDRELPVVFGPDLDGILEWSFVEGGGEHLGEGDLIIGQHGVFGARYVRTFCSVWRAPGGAPIGSYGVLLLHPWVLVGVGRMHSPRFP